MIKPGKIFFIRQMLHYYVTWIVKHHFHELKFNPVDVDNNKSILLIANHFSFWDSLILYVACYKLLKKQFYVMVQEGTTAPLRFLRYGGAFSIRKNSKEIIGSLNYAAGLLNDPHNLVLIFPQGKLYSNFVNDIHFEKGVARIMDNAKGKFRLVLAATFVQYLDHRKPTAAVYLKTEPDELKSLEELKIAYQKHYDNAKLQQTEIVI